MIHITENDRRIDDYRSLRFTPPNHTETGIFVAEGEKTVRRLLRSGVEVVSMLAQQDFYTKYADEIRRKSVPEESMFVADKSVLESIVGFRLHQGILAIGRQVGESALDAMSERILVLNRVIDAENVGAMVRSAVAFGIDSFLLDRASAHPFLRRAVRVSLGACFSIKYRMTDSLASDLLALKQAGYSVVAAEQSDDSVSVWEYQFADRFALVMGSEGLGIVPEILGVSDSVVELPVSADVDSLNVAATAAALLFEQARQRDAAGK